MLLGFEAGDHIDSLTAVQHKDGLVAIGAVIVMIVLWLVLRKRGQRRAA